MGVCDVGAIFHLWSYQGLVDYSFGLRGCSDSSSDETESSVGISCHLFHIFVPGEVWWYLYPLVGGCVNSTQGLAFEAYSLWAWASFFLVTCIMWHFEGLNDLPKNVSHSCRLSGSCWSWSQSALVFTSLFMMLSYDADIGLKSILIRLYIWVKDFISPLIWSTNYYTWNLYIEAN